MSDRLFCGRRLKTFNVVDDFNRVALSIKVDLNLSALSVPVVKRLRRTTAWRGYSKLHMHNSPQFISVTLSCRAEVSHVEPEFIKPGKPTQNSDVERFNCTCMDETLMTSVFRTLA